MFGVAHSPHCVYSYARTRRIIIIGEIFVHLVHAKAACESFASLTTLNLPVKIWARHAGLAHANLRVCVKAVSVKLHLNGQTDTSVCPIVRGQTDRGINPVTHTEWRLLS